MRIGTRWPIGAPAPAHLTPGMHRAIRQAETGLDDAQRARWGWTLTWLEGFPVVTRDDGLRIRQARTPDEAIIDDVDDEI